MKRRIKPAKTASLAELRAKYSLPGRLKRPSGRGRIVRVGKKAVYLGPTGRVEIRQG